MIGKSSPAPTSCSCQQVKVTATEIASLDHRFHCVTHTHHVWVVLTKWCVNFTVQIKQILGFGSHRVSRGRTNRHIVSILLVPACSSCVSRPSTALVDETLNWPTHTFSYFFLEQLSALATTATGVHRRSHQLLHCRSSSWRCKCCGLSFGFFLSFLIC